MILRFLNWMAIWVIVSSIDKTKTERGVNFKKKTLFWSKMPNEAFQGKYLVGNWNLISPHTTECVKTTVYCRDSKKLIWSGIVMKLYGF